MGVDQTIPASVQFKTEQTYIFNIIQLSSLLLLRLMGLPILSIPLVFEKEAMWGSVTV